MSLTFKLTIPDGVLCEHLKDRDSKSRNFELIRLATNALIGGVTSSSNFQFNTQPMAEVIPATNDTDYKTPDSQDSPSSYKVIEYDTKRYDSKIDTSTNQETILEPSGENVDFGDDLLSMN